MIQRLLQEKQQEEKDNERSRTRAEKAPRFRRD
jgi:hypothetical protein